MARCMGSSSLGTRPDVYLYSIAKSPDRSSLAVIASDDSLRLFDWNLEPVAAAAARCHVGVECLTASDPAYYVTGGRDGLVRCWDSQAKTVAEFADPRGNGISAVACHGHYIAAGTESTKEGLGEVSVLLFDTRNPSRPLLRQYHDSHTDTITQLRFHPSLPHLLLSSSTDGLVSLFDVNHADEVVALQQVLNPRSAVHRAGFLAPDLVYVVSTDEQYSLHTLARSPAAAAADDDDDELVPPPVNFGDVRDRLSCMYVIDVLLQPDGPPLMAYGHNVNRTLALVSLGAPGAWHFGPVLDLPGAHGEEVVRDILLDGQRIFSCGEDGKVKVWVMNPEG